MILTAFILLVLMFMGISFIYGFYYGANITAEEYELRDRVTLETQMKCRIEGTDMEAISDYKADSYLINRLDSTGAKTIVTVNQN